MTEYDSPWKEAFERYFEAFKALCFPELWAHIDWSVPPKLLDKELQQIAPQSDVGQRTVDKLVEVRLLSGEYDPTFDPTTRRTSRTTGYSAKGSG